MMISSETYYEIHLKGKNQQELLIAIQELKIEIEHLKNLLEQPNYHFTMHTKPSESTRLWYTRQYLERAKKAFTDIGGIYIPSQEELKAQAFDDSISVINKLIFTIGGFFNGYETHTFTIDGDHLYMDVKHSYNPARMKSRMELDPIITKQEFLEELFGLHLGEWRHSYRNDQICDGTQWNLEIQYSDGQEPFKVSGSNAFPFNFDELRELTNIDTKDKT